MKQHTGAVTVMIESGKPPLKGASAQSIIDTAIATELAPAVAIELLARSSQTAESGQAALEALGAGVSKAEDDGTVRIQLLFENGAVLPVEMSKEAGAALASGLAAQTRGPTDLP
jgi:hypothetical protein